MSIKLKQVVKFMSSLQYLMIAKIGEENLLKLVDKLSKSNLYAQALEKGAQKYQIRQYKINSLAPQNILELYNSLKVKFYFTKSSEENESWYENELRVFLWLLVGYSYAQKRCISEMSKVDWQLFSSIFNERRPQMFQFQAYSILKREIKTDNWQLDEVSLLDSIIKTKSIKNKWNQIAKDLFIRSKKKYFRTAKQCREYWINHLDPVPTRSNWTAAEDFNLIETVKTIGKKWSQVSKKLGGRRTQHMVKNRFKALTNYQLKRRPIFDLQVPSEQKVMETLSKRLKNNIEAEQNLENFNDIVMKKNEKTCENVEFVDKNVMNDSNYEEKLELDDLSIQDGDKKEETPLAMDENYEQMDMQGENILLNSYFNGINEENGAAFQKCLDQFFSDPLFPRLE